MEPAVVKFKKRPEKKRLNKRTVETLPLPPEVNGKPMQSWVYDSVTPRLSICVWSTGARSWYWVGRVDGRPARLKLGEYPEITPEQAGKLAAKTSLAVANGTDPRQERNERRAQLTLGELFERYLEDYAKLHKKSWKEDERQFNCYCASVRGRPIGKFTRGDVMGLHAKVGKSGRYAANRLLALLSKMYSFAMLKVGFKGENPCKGVTKFREESRERFLNADELQRFFTALAKEGQYWADFFSLLLLTGVRRRTLQAARSEQFNIKDAIWKIAETKNGKPLTVHLAKEALEIVTRRLEENDPWLFPGHRKGHHLNSPARAWSRVCEKAKLTDLRMHDLRRSIGSWMTACGTSLPIVGKALGHIDGKSTAIYARLDLDPVRAAVDAAVAAMLAAGKKK